jgi:hypothetical protein
MSEGLAKQLAARLRLWNTVCTIEEQPEYATWLAANFPHWPFAEEFSRLRVETIDPLHKMLFKDGIDCIGWFSPEAVMNDADEFTGDGMLKFGASACGDFLVIDTRAASDLAIGLVSHEKYWESRKSPRAAYTAWPDPLLLFLDRLWAEPEYAHSF